MRRFPFAFAFAALAAAALLQACGGGGGGSSSSAPPVTAPATQSAAPTPVPVPSLAVTPSAGPTANVAGTYGPIPAFTASPIAITPASGNTTISISNVNGITGALNLGTVDPNNGAGTSYTVTLSNAPYSGVPDFATTVPGVKGELLYLLASPAASVNYLGGATLALNLPPKYQGASGYYVSFYVAGQNFSPSWPSSPAQTGLTVYKAAINGSQIVFTFGNLSLAANLQYSIVLYGV